MTKQVHTSIDEETAKKAAIYDIGWASAIRIGVEVLSGVNNERQNIIDKIQRNEMENVVLKSELKKIEESEKKKEEEKRSRTIMEF